MATKKENVKKIVHVQVNEISDQEKVNNVRMARILVVGERYRFNPHMNASAVPQNTYLAGLPSFDFQFGTYLGMQDDRLVFEGYPVDAPEKTAEWKFYFFVSFADSGSKLTHMRKVANAAH